MAKTIISVERVNSVEVHPDADRLEIVQVLGYKVITQKGKFKVGDAAIYFPPDILIPEKVADEFQVKQYLKHSLYPGDEVKTQCRVSSARIRGIPSHGFVVGPVAHDGAFGTDLTQRYGGYKYEPPVRVGAGDIVSGNPFFHKYTNIENIQRRNYFDEGEPVRITEKIHGTNCRVGIIREAEQWVFAAGSHNLRRDQPSMYWKPMTENMVAMLNTLCDGQHNIVVFGELFGPGIQTMDYGQPEQRFQVFDISKDGVYADWETVQLMCLAFNIPTVPLLYEGPFSQAVVDKFTDGPTVLAPPGMIKCPFKGREGIVITPLKERVVRSDRVIAKSVSADYRDKESWQEVGE